MTSDDRYRFFIGAFDSDVIRLTQNLYTNTSKYVFCNGFYPKIHLKQAFYLAAHTVEQTIVHLDVNSNNKNDILSIKILI